MEPRRVPVAVIGAGLMGQGIGQLLAVHGHPVSLMDLKRSLLDKAIEKIRSNLIWMAQNNIYCLDKINSSISPIKTTTELKEAVEDAQFVIEAVNEDLELKQEIFREMDMLCPEDVILATNTSAISITEVAGKALNRSRILGTHFWNPPYLIPLVEVIKGQETNEKAMDRTCEFLKEAGKHPVRVNKDVPGFVGNRLQHALWREAISIVEHGIADPATVDECVKFGFGLRLPALGPLENSDMVGLDLTLAIHKYLLKHLESSPYSSSLLREKVDNGELGFKTGRGFYQWTPHQTEESRNNLENYLIGLVRGKM